MSFDPPFQSNYGESLARIDELVGPGSRPPTPRVTTRENAAIFLLLLGGFVWLIGWLPGAALLWRSDRWTLRDKLIGTLVVPGGLATGPWLFVFDGHELGSTFSYVAFAALLVCPIASAAYLRRRLRTQLLNHQ